MGMPTSDLRSLVHPSYRLRSTTTKRSLHSGFSRVSVADISALSYDWSKGHSGAPQPGQNPTKVLLHPVKPDEVKKKATR